MENCGGGREGVGKGEGGVEAGKKGLKKNILKL